MVQVEQSPIGSYKKRIAEKIAHLRRINRIYTWGDNIPEPLIDFEELDLPSPLLESLNEFGIKEPTPIQMQALPLMRQRRDVLASAPTGSGKTLAFALPVILDVLRQKDRTKNKNCTTLLAIVLEPTRELAAQTYHQFLKFGQNLPITSAYFDKEEIPNADILVSTPNRLTHHLKDFNLKALRWLIVDESDRLFEVIEGQERCFRNQVSFFISLLLMCNILLLICYIALKHGKIIALRTLLLTEFDPPALIFVQSKERARELMTAISSFSHPVPVDYISSEKSQVERDSAIESFRAGRIWVLICTELMGRGLDFKNVNLVINFDLPTSVISYIHRVGRAITYFTESDMKYLRPIATVISQAGFEVPEYVLTLKPVNRQDRASNALFIDEKMFTVDPACNSQNNGQIRSDKKKFIEDSGSVGLKTLPIRELDISTRLLSRTCYNNLDSFKQVPLIRMPLKGPINPLRDYYVPAAQPQLKLSNLLIQASPAHQEYWIRDKSKARLKCIKGTCPIRIHENDINAILDEEEVTYH
uniref:ATP-dependent RNA helicase n=1 Tax=Heterorhabditis bacteriophora TaxID=37862 RepID=A0A1I7WNQ2_HETBA